MEKMLIIFAFFSALNMIATPTLALYALHVMRKYKRAMYKEGYYQGFIEGQMQVSHKESGIRKDCIHCESCTWKKGQEA